MKVFTASVIAGTLLLAVGCARKESGTAEDATRIESLRNDAEKGLAEVDAMLADIDAFEKSRALSPAGPSELETEPLARGVDLTGGDLVETLERSGEPAAPEPPTRGARSGGGRKPNFLDKGWQKELDEKAKKAREEGAQTAATYRNTLKELDEVNDGITFGGKGRRERERLEKKLKDLKEKAHEQSEAWKKAQEEAEKHAKDKGIR